MPVFYVHGSVNDKVVKFGILANTSEEAYEAAQCINLEESGSDFIAECEHPSATVFVVNDDSNKQKKDDEPAAARLIAATPKASVAEGSPAVAVKRFWTRKGTSHLISICRDLRVEQAESRKGGKGSKWAAVAQAMRNLGYWVTPSQCRFKWWREKDAFRKFKDGTKIASRSYGRSDSISRVLPRNSISIEESGSQFISEYEQPSTTVLITDDDSITIEEPGHFALEEPSARVFISKDDLKKEHDKGGPQGALTAPPVPVRAADMEPVQVAPVARVWSAAGVSALISTCGSLKIDRAESRKRGRSSKWAAVAQIMRDLGFPVSSSQCRAKWFQEKLSYRNSARAQDENKHSYPFFEEMSQALPDEPAAHPVPDTQEDGQAPDEASGADGRLAVAVGRNSTICEQLLKSNCAIAAALDKFSASNDKIAKALEENNRIHQRLAAAIEKIADSLSRQETATQIMSF